MLKSLSLAVITVFSASLIYASDQVSDSRTSYDSVKSLIDPVLYLSPSSVYPKDMMATPLAPSSTTDWFSVDPFEVTYSGSAFWSGVRNVTYSDGYAYLAMTNGLMIVDVSDPTAPVSVSRVYLQNGYATAAAVQGNLAYVTCWGGTRDGSYHGTLYMVDVADKAHPVLLSSMETNQRDAYSITVHGYWAYVGVREALLVVDISDPMAPQIEDMFLTDYTPHGTVVWEGYLYVPAGTAVKIYDVTDPSSPTWVTDLATPQRAVVVDVCNGVLAIADADWMWPAFNATLQLADISDPGAPVLGASNRIVGELMSLAVESSYVYVAGETGVTIAEVISFDSLVVHSSYPAPGFCRGIAVYNNLLYVASLKTEATDDSSPDCDTCACSTFPDTSLVRRGDFQIIDVSDKTAPCVKGLIRKGMSALDVAATEDYVYIVGREDEYAIGIIDARSTDTLFEAGLLPIDFSSSGVFVADNMLYVMLGAEGIALYDISNPVLPLKTAALALPGEAAYADIKDDVLYIAANSEGLLLVDVSDKYDPRPISQYDTPYFATDVVVDGDMAFVADVMGGLVIVDVSNVHAPQFVSNFPTSGIIVHVKERDGLAFVRESYGLTAIDVSEPSDPRELDYIDIGLWAGNLDVIWEDTQVIVDCGYDGLVFVDGSDPANLDINGFYDSPGFSDAVAIDDNYLWLADHWSLIRLTLPTPTGVDDPDEPINLPSQFQLAQNYPNPFNPITKIQFSLPERSHTKITIYNILGEKVRQVLDKELPAGEHEVHWDGRDDAGKTLATGVYFYRLETADFVETKKMLLLK